MITGIKLIRKEEIVRKTWSGGTMSEYLNYPDSSTFEDRDFIFNISSATVDLEKSEFTNFPGYMRIITTLTEPLELVHDDVERITLSRYQPHTFSGEMKTESFGKVQDFNFVMDQKKCQGDFSALTLTKNSVVYPKEGYWKADEVLEMVFCVKGCFFLCTATEKMKIDAGDLLVVDRNKISGCFRYEAENDELCDIIICTAVINY